MVQFKGDASRGAGLSLILEGEAGRGDAAAMRRQCRGKGPSGSHRCDVCLLL